MNAGAVLLLAIINAVLFMLIQRSEARRRRFTTAVMAVIVFLLWYWAQARALGSEFTLALALALLANVFFWLLIGRYNPVRRSEDSIRVLGMDD